MFLTGVPLLRGTSDRNVAFSRFMEIRLARLAKTSIAEQLGGYEIHMPPNLSSRYFRTAWRFASMNCLEKEVVGTGRSRYLRLSDATFSNELERNLSFKLAKETVLMQHEKAYKTFDKMRKSKLPLTVRPFEMLLEMNKYDVTAARMLFSTMQRLNVTPSRHAYICYAVALARGGKIDEAFPIVFDKLQADESTLVELIKGCGEFGNLTQLHTIISQMKQSNVQPTFSLLAAMFDAFGLLQDQNSALSLWGKISSSDDTFADVVAPMENLPSTIFDEPAKPQGWVLPGV